MTMQRAIGRRLAVLVVMGGMAGCAVSAPDAGTVAPQAGASTGGPCPPFGCNANSPVVDSFGFHDLLLGGPPGPASRTVPNSAGFSITALNGVAQITKASTTYDLAVTDGRFVGTRCRGSRCARLEGQGLIGATIQLARGESQYRLEITSVRPIDYFVGTAGQVEGYTLLWSTPAQKPVNLCNNITLLEQQLAMLPGGQDGAAASEELVGMRTFEAVVFEGDEIYSDSMKFDARVDDQRFNIACAGHTLSKLLLTHNTSHSQTPGLPQALEHRQSTLKMLVADYCGTGAGLTVAGQALVWQGDQMTYHAQPRELEARWGPDGAQCLTAPRMLFPSTSLGAKTFPDIWGSIKAVCAAAGVPVPLPCADPDPFAYDGAFRVSANP